MVWRICPSRNSGRKLRQHCLDETKGKDKRLLPAKYRKRNRTLFRIGSGCRHPWRIHGQRQDEVVSDSIIPDVIRRLSDRNNGICQSKRLYRCE